MCRNLDYCDTLLHTWRGYPYSGTTIFPPSSPVVFKNSSSLWFILSQNIPKRPVWLLLFDGDRTVRRENSPISLQQGIREGTRSKYIENILWNHLNTPVVLRSVSLITFLPHQHQSKVQPTKISWQLRWDLPCAAGTWAGWGLEENGKQLQKDIYEVLRPWHEEKKLGCFCRRGCKSHCHNSFSHRSLGLSNPTNFIWIFFLP